MNTEEILIPTKEEVTRWLLHVVQHVCHIEYYLHELGLLPDDPERPHDTVGPGNKFEWEVIRGFAVSARNDTPEFFDRHVMPALNRHRLQYHHRVWNEPTDDVAPDDMRLGAVDAICSLLEPRKYQGGVHTYAQILKIAEENPPPHRQWLTELIPKMQRIAPPDLFRITSLDEVPNIGIPRHIHDALLARITETRLQITSLQGYVL